MNPAIFPPGSIRRAVAAFGDAWTADFISPAFECPPMRAELRDTMVMNDCGALASRDRGATMPARAYIQINRDEVAS